MSATEFGQFLRARREATRPEALGLPNGQRRRTPGLRRQELAERAGIGIDWLIRLEQGRAVAPSRATIEALQHLVLGLPDPAYIVGRRWDLLAWNGAAEDLFGAFDEVPEDDRNVLRYFTLDPRARRVFGAGWEEELGGAIARFRVSHDLWSGDPAFTGLVEALSASSAEFRAHWRDHAVAEPQSRRKHLVHPRLGPTTYDLSSFQSDDDPRLRLVLYCQI